MSVKTIQEFNLMLADDCKFSIELFYQENNWSNYPRPYAVISDYWNNSESYRILFPESTEEMDRPTQYYTLSRAISNFWVSRAGIVAYLELEVPHRPEINEAFWGRTSRAALIGSAVREHSKAHTHHAKQTQAYQTEVMLFDMIDGNLEFCTVSDQSIWEDFVDNVSLFRDFLFFSAFPTPHSPYRWVDLIQHMKAYGFDFDFNSEDNMTQFLVSQPALIAT